jgi:hypothetical protein
VTDDDEDEVRLQLTMTGWLPDGVILTPTENGYRMTMPPLKEDDARP